MVSKTELVKMFRHLKKRERGIPDRRLIHPIRDWVMGLCAVCLIFIASSIYAGYTFLEGSKNVDTEIPFESSVIVYDREGALKVLEEYASKTNTFKSLRSNRSNIVILPPVVSNDNNDAEEDNSDTLLAE